MCLKPKTTKIVLKLLILISFHFFISYTGFDSLEIVH